MSELCYDAPWWLWAIPAAAGVGLLISGNARQNKRLLRPGFALAALALLILAVSWLMDTPREKAIAQTRSLVKQIAASDWTGFAAHLSPHTQLAVVDREVFNSSDQIIYSAKLAQEKWPIESLTILGLQTSDDPRPPIAVTIKVLSQHGPPGPGAMTSIWRLEWEQTPAGLRLRRVTAVSIEGVSAESIRGRVPGM